MLNPSQATVSIGFSIHKGARARFLVRYSICGGCLLGACRVEARQSVDGPADKKLEIDAHDLTNATKWYNLSLESFTQTKSKHPNNISRRKK